MVHCVGSVTAVRTGGHGNYGNRRVGLACECWCPFAYSWSEQDVRWVKTIYRTQIKNSGPMSKMLIEMASIKMSKSIEILLKVL